MGRKNGKPKFGPFVAEERAQGSGGEIPSFREGASIAFVWSPAQPPPAFRVFAGRCPTPHFYE